MAKASATKPTHSKLPHLPNTTRIQKRPLIHPPVASALTSSAHSPKIIYIRASTPFISTIKRVRKHLSAMHARETQTAYPTRPSAPSGLMGVSDEVFFERLRREADSREKGEKVLVKGTGKAIQRVLEIAAFFEGDGSLDVRLRTGSVGAVDDLIDGEDVTEDGVRLRRVSVLEVAICEK